MKYSIYLVIPAKAGIQDHFQYRVDASHINNECEGFSIYSQG